MGYIGHAQYGGDDENGMLGANANEMQQQAQGANNDHDNNGEEAYALECPLPSEDAGFAWIPDLVSRSTPRPTSPGAI